MNKTELVHAIADKTVMNLKDSAKAVDATVEAITESLKKKESVQIIGFGSAHSRLENVLQGKAGARRLEKK